MLLIESFDYTILGQIAKTSYGGSCNYTIQLLIIKIEPSNLYMC